MQSQALADLTQKHPREAFPKDLNSNPQKGLPFSFYQSRERNFRSPTTLVHLLQCSATKIKDTISQSPSITERRGDVSFLSPLYEEGQAKSLKVAQNVIPKRAAPRSVLLHSESTATFPKQGGTSFTVERPTSSLPAWLTGFQF